MKNIENSETNFNTATPMQVGLLILVLGALSVFSLNIAPNPIFEDDAFFYWLSAVRTIESGFPTFDGYEPTNGFHWLWYLILTAAAFFADQLGFATLTGKAFFLISVSLIVWAFIFKKVYAGLLPLALIAALFIGFTMETALAGLLLGIAYTELLNKRSPVVWLTLAMLVRIDLVIAALFLLPLLKKKELLLLLCGIVIAASSSLAVNYLLVGDFFTVSSQIKALGASKTFEGILSTVAGNTSSYGNIYRYLLAISLSIAATYLYLTHFREYIKTNVFALTLISANSFLVAHSLISNMRDWYFAPTIVSLLAVVSFFLFKLKTDRSIRTWPYSSLAALGVGLLALYSFKFYPSWASSKAFHIEACQALESERIFVYDGSGSLAWNLNHCGTVTNGDGLVNSHEYLREVIAKRRYFEYLREHNISLYIVNRTDIPDNCLHQDVCVDPGNVKVLARAESGSYYTSYRLVKILDLNGL